MNRPGTNAAEGRASTVRPSLRLFLAVALSLALIVAMAPAAQAALTPALTGTNPASPGASLTPRIRGDADGVITSVVHRSVLAGPIGRTLEPGNIITLYTKAECAAPVVAEGTAEELEGAGIAATVAPDSETTFYATQTDLGGTSSCSNGIVYQQVTTPPGPPVFTATNPASPANDNFPRLSGSAAANSIVTLFSDQTCAGGTVAAGTAAAFAAGGIQVQVPDNTTTTFHAIATLAGISSACSSSSISYREVTPAEVPTGGGGTTTPPVSNPPGKPQPPRLRTIPGGIANDATPLITGSAPGASTVKIYSSADCKGPALVRGSAAQLQAGLPVQIVPNTTIAFYGKSVDGGGDESDCSPEPAVYSDDSIAPRTRITAGPGVKTLKRTVVFRFADITGGLETKFLCKVDRMPWKSCHPPLRLKNLGHKRHVLRVKAYDAAGNREKTGVKRSFQVLSSP